jgi:hypothetical protein
MVDAADGLLAEARGHGVEVRAGAAATGWYAGMVSAMDRDTTMELRPRAVVAATGSYELVPAVPGSDKPGVMGARLVVRLLARHGVLPGERALLVGAGEELDAAGAALEAAGATAVGPVPTAALRSIGGRGPVAWARHAESGGGGTTRRERVDLVVFGDRTPNLDLVLAAGGRVGWHGDRLAPELDLNGMTSLPGLFVAGDAAGVPADSTTAETQARIAGAAAGRFARAATTVATGAPALPAMTRTGDPPRSTSIGQPPAAASARAVLCFCEDVRAWEVRDELVAGYADPELVKRRTGALTGPCQGKYCLSAITCAIGAGGPEAAHASGATETRDLHLPTARPPLRPLRLRDLIADDAPGASAAGPPASDAASQR